MCVLKKTVDAVVEEAFLEVAAAEDGFVRDKESRELTHTHILNMSNIYCAFLVTAMYVSAYHREVPAQDPRVRGGGGRRQGDLGPDRVPLPGRHVLRRRVGACLRLRVLARGHVPRLRLLARGRGPVPRQHLRTPARRWRCAVEVCAPCAAAVVTSVEEETSTSSTTSTTRSPCPACPRCPDMVEETPCEACPSCAVCARCPKVEEVSASQGPVAVPTSAADNTVAYILAGILAVVSAAFFVSRGMLVRFSRQNGRLVAEKEMLVKNLNTAKQRLLGVRGRRDVGAPRAAPRTTTTRSSTSPPCSSAAGPGGCPGPMNSTRVGVGRVRPAQVQPLGGGGGGGTVWRWTLSRFNVCVSCFK